MVMFNPLKPLQRLLNNKALKQQQSDQLAGLAFIQHEFADHPSRGLTPQRLAQLFEDAEQGDLQAQMDLYEDMEEKDGHIAAELGKRKRALLGLPWDIQPPRDATAQEAEQAAFIKALLLDLNDFEDIILNLAGAIGYGFSCLEIEWGRVANQHRPIALHHRPQRWFTLPQFDRNQIRLRDGSLDGAELWPAGWLVHVHKAKSGDVSRAGLHRALAWPFLFKNYAVRDLAEFLEIYGLPVRVGHYPMGATDNEKTTLLRAVTNMGHNAAGIIPEGMVIEFMEAAKGGSDPFEAMIAWCERTQSKVILGGTLTSQADGKTSTNALGNVHNEVRHDLLVADAMQIAGSLTHLVRLICQVNGWVSDPYRMPRFVFDTTEPEDLGLYADALPKLAQAGAKIPLRWVHDRLKIPQAEGDEPVLTVASPAPVQALAALAGDTQPRFTEDQQAIEALADALPKISPLKKAAIESAIKAATSPDDLEQRLAVVLSDADLTEFSRILEQALFAADVMGYAHGK